jgi:hypothetical protein
MGWLDLNGFSQALITAFPVFTGNHHTFDRVIGEELLLDVIIDLLS